MKMLGNALALLALLPEADGEQASSRGQRIAAAARQQIGVTRSYDPGYVALGYPGGDVPVHTGVCSDVVVRAFRQVGIDLQKAVHEDMRTNFRAYPQKWGLTKPDRNIDHRRVPNLMRYFERHQVAVNEKLKLSETYHPGDVVVWDIGNGVLHVGIVSDGKSGGVPLIIHNIGSGTREEDLLFKYTVLGHYRLKEIASHDGLATGGQPMRPTTNQTTAVKTLRR
ncbi:MAG: DUF1287 domain-containing protein [Verrucomicrobia bacterium]|nr:DUF1287 domain-containing protein [Verrucomicrobiota bacterium]